MYMHMLVTVSTYVYEYVLQTFVSGMGLVLTVGARMQGRTSSGKGALATLSYHVKIH